MIHPPALEKSDPTERLAQERQPHRATAHRPKEGLDRVVNPTRLLSQACEGDARAGLGTFPLHPRAPWRLQGASATERARARAQSINPISVRQRHP